MDNPSTSNDSATAECPEITPDNIGKNTTDLLKRIIWKLKHDQLNNDTPLSNPMGRAARYTGMHVTNLEKLLGLGQFMNIEDKTINRSSIHKVITNHLLNKNIPSISELFDDLITKLPTYVDINYFTKILIKMGYVFYKFPGRKTLRVMEKKSITFERFRYLRNIQQYRQLGFPIIYIGIASFSRSMEVLDLENTLQTDIEDISSYVFFTASNNAIENVHVIDAMPDEKLKEHVNNWLVEIFAVKGLPQNSVCVIEDSKIFQDALIDVPTWKSVKIDMVEWLEENKIPCDISMSKADLLQLIETCYADKKNVYVIDNLAKLHNYSVLRLPQCIKGLSIAALIIQSNNRFFSYECNRITHPKVTLANPHESQLRRFSVIIEVDEEQLLHEDKKIDNVLDKLVRNMKTSTSTDFKGNEDDSVLFNFRDSD